MKLDYYKPVKVEIHIPDYLDGIFYEVPELWLNGTPTLAANNILEVSQTSITLATAEAKI